MSQYDLLMSKVRKAIVLHNIYDLLEWDQKVVMPIGALEYRMVHVGVVSQLMEEILGDSEIGLLLSEIDEHTLSGDEKANLNEIKRMFAKSNKITPELAKEITETLTKATEVWREAKAKRDFNSFLPWLEKTFDLAKKKASFRPDEHPYAVLLEDFTYIPFEVVKQEIEKLKQAALGLIREDECREIDVPCDFQKRFVRDMLEKIGFNFKLGRLDESTHPFSVCHGRMTVNYGGWRRSIFSALHEAGHGFYDQGLPKELFGEPIGLQRSHAIHETQSKIWEDFIGKSRSFWKFFFLKLQKDYSPYFDHVTFDGFFKMVNCVRPKDIRLGSDEVTYILHIVLRFEIELDVMEGRLAVKDIPVEWKRKTKEYLGLDVEDYNCLQDIHWSRAGIGYFPAYAVGLIGAAQMFKAMKEDISDFDLKISKGNFSDVHHWLKNKVWNLGSKLEEPDLIRFATGKNFSSDDYISYLNDKFGE